MNKLMYLGLGIIGGVALAKIYNSATSAGSSGGGDLQTGLPAGPSTKIGASWYCQKNPHGPGCEGGNIHTIILPMPVRATAPVMRQSMIGGSMGLM